MSNENANQFLTFTLGDEIFGLNISKVREVLELTNITRVPRTPEFMRGVMNVRGQAVPVIDMRRKFGLDVAEDTVNTCIIIVEVETEGESITVGALADSVREVLEMDSTAIDAAPRMGAAVDTEFIQGMGRQDDDFVIFLDIDRVFSVEELSSMNVGEEQAA